MNISRRVLFGKLNLSLFRAIESATALAKLRGNPYVELVHWVHQVWQVPGNDWHRIAAHCALDVAQLEADMVVALSALPHGASGLNDFSRYIEIATERAVCQSLPGLTLREHHSLSVDSAMPFFAGHLVPSKEST